MSTNNVVKIDPNFDLPRGVRDIEYSTPDKTDSSLQRSDDTGVFYSVSYDEPDVVGPDSDFPQGGTNTGSLGLRPPDYINVVSQVMRLTTDGRYVVDVII